MKFQAKKATIALPFSGTFGLLRWVENYRHMRLPLKGRLPRRVRELLGIMHYIYSYFQIVSLFQFIFYFLILALKIDFVYISYYLFLLVNLVHRHINGIP